MTELVHVSDANYEELITKAAKPALLDFGATWCGPCKALEPSVVALAKEYGDRVTISKLDIDEAPETAQRFGSWRSRPPPLKNGKISLHRRSVEGEIVSRFRAIYSRGRRSSHAARSWRAVGTGFSSFSY
jgi:thioredoxin 1